VDIGGGRRLWRQEAGSIILRKKTRERFTKLSNVSDLVRSKSEVPKQKVPNVT